MAEGRRNDPFADREPPEALRQRITTTLSRDGLVEPKSARVRRQAAQGTMLLALMVIAFFAGRMEKQPAADARPQFLLLLYEDSTYRDDRPIREIIAEYGRWADSLRERRELDLGEKLGDAHAELPAGAEPATAVPTGLFIVRATDLETARAIAGSSPHLRQGGRIVVHAIDH
jgi:hypothetical protein